MADAGCASGGSSMARCGVGTGGSLRRGVDVRAKTRLVPRMRMPMDTSVRSYVHTPTRLVVSGWVSGALCGTRFGVRNLAEIGPSTLPCPARLPPRGLARGREI